MVLAAGQGTRLGALGRRIPKVLLEVGGRTLLARHLERLHAVGVARVVVNVHHLRDHVEAFVAEYDGPLELIVSREQELLGTAGGVRKALARLTPGPFIVVYGDVVFEDPFDGLIERHHSSGADATLAVHRGTSAAGKGTVEVDDNGMVDAFAEKPAFARQGDFLINSGIYVLETDFVASLPAGVPLDFGHDVLPASLSSGARVATFVLSHPVVDVGTPEGIEEAGTSLLPNDAPRHD
jgi:mannose-1-phosphate guanylyltransferase